MSTLSDPEIFRDILENLQTGVYVLDRDQNILFWIAGAERILGKLPNKIYVEGHTDSKAYSENSNYTN
jgi:PAS domain-containing protein